jgi:hypothetical protein
MTHAKEKVNRKRGPKGPWKAKGKALDLIVKLSEDEPALPAHAIAARLEERIGVKLTPRRIQQIRHEIGGKSCSRRSGMEAPSPATPASLSWPPSS